MKRKAGTKVDEKQQQKSRQEAWGKHLAAPMPPCALLPCQYPPLMPLDFLSGLPSFLPSRVSYGTAPVLASFRLFLICPSFTFFPVLFFLPCIPSLPPSFLTTTSSLVFLLLYPFFLSFFILLHRPLHSLPCLPLLLSYFQTSTSLFPHFLLFLFSPFVLPMLSSFPLSLF